MTGADWDGYAEVMRPQAMLRPRNNTSAAIAAVCAALTLFTCGLSAIPALGFGLAGLAESSRTGVGHGQAVAGVIVGGLVVLGWAGFALLMVIGAMTS